MQYFASPTILQESKDSILAWSAIAPIWKELPYGKAKELPLFMSKLTEGQRGLISLDWCQKEIRNGGFQQLFMNATGNLVPWAIAGFSLVGAHPFSRILEEAAATLGGTYPSNPSARKKALSALNADNKIRLQELEDTFFRLLNNGQHDLEKYRGEYVRSHPSEFVRN